MTDKAVIEYAQLIIHSENGAKPVMMSLSCQEELEQNGLVKRNETNERDTFNNWLVITPLVIR